MNYSHVIFCGDSYMKCYVDSDGPRQLCDKLKAIPVTMVRSGSSHEYVLRRIYNEVITKPRCLVVWGLTHVFRTEYPVKGRWLTLNYDRIMRDDGEPGYEDRDLTDTLIATNALNIDNLNLYMEWSLQQMDMLGRWLLSEGHDFLIFNQCCTDYAKIADRDWPVLLSIRKQKRFYRIFDWYMNQHLHESGVGVRPADRHFFSRDFALPMHPLEGQLLADTVNDFILERLR